MTRQSTANHPVFSASHVLEAIAKALSEIKHHDRLTYADLGAVLGKSEDQAAKYCDGSASMDAITFARGKREWGARFTGYYDRLCEDSRPGQVCDRSTLTAVLDAASCLSRALEDGDIEAEEIRENRAALERARDLIDAQLGKLRLVA